MNDFCDGCVFRTLGDFNFQGAICIERSSEHFRTWTLIGWYGFAGDGSFVNGRFTLHDYAVHGNFLTRTNDQRVSDFHFIDRNFHLYR